MKLFQTFKVFHHCHFRAFSNDIKKKVGILGDPFGKGQKDPGDKEKGLELAPDAIRGTSLIKDLKSLGADVKDFGNVSYKTMDSSLGDPRMKNYIHVIPNMKKISEAVYDVLKEDRTCLTLGGDHSIFTGTLHGHLQSAGAENVAVVYVDAHADINLSSTTISGNIHGMSVAMTLEELKEDWKHCPNMEWLNCRLPVRSLGYIGLRSVDPPEAQIIAKHNIAAYSMTDVVRFGIHEVLIRLLKEIDPNNNKSIHLSIDTDSLDPLEAPSTTVPVRGGLRLCDLIYIAETLSKTNRVKAVDWVELNPLLGSREDQVRTLDAARYALLACFGNTTSGNFE